MTTSLNDGVKKREVLAWASYDFANSGYTTVVLTAVFNAYFVNVVAQGTAWATFAWTLALSLSYALVMLTLPSLGAWADQHAAKKKVLVLSTLGCILATAALAWAQPGMLALAVLAIVLSNWCYSIGETFIAAFLPELAKPEAMGRVSGWGWSIGYLGGLLCLGLCLVYVFHAQARSLPATHYVPVTMLIVAAVYGVAALPTLLLLQERAQPRATQSLGLWHLLREVRQFHAFYWLLWCALFYQAGIAVVITLAAIYAQEVMGFTTAKTMMLILAVNITAAIGAFSFGYAQDALGHRRALALTLWAWLAMTTLAALSQSELAFWVAANLAGLCMGSSQSAGRAMAGLLAPSERRAEFYGLWAFATRLSFILGPLTYGTLTLVTNNNHRLAIGLTGVFFLIALGLLRRVRM